MAALSPLLRACLVVALLSAPACAVALAPEAGTPERALPLQRGASSRAEGADSGRREGVTSPDPAGHGVHIFLPERPEGTSSPSTREEKPSSHVERRELAESTGLTFPETSSFKAPVLKGKKAVPIDLLRKELPLIGYMSLPTFGGSPSELILRGSTPNPKPQSGVAPAGFATCNKGLPAARVVPGLEDAGLSSGVVLLLLVTRAGPVGLCSGAMIAPTLVLTAAHCLYDTDKNKWMVGGSVNLAAFVQVNGAGADDTYFGAYYDEVQIYTEFQQAPSFQSTLLNGSDLAVVKLKDALPGQTYTWSAPKGSDPRANFGYPAVTNDGVSLVYDVTSKSVTLGCFQLSSSILCQDVSVEGGMSGGPTVGPYDGTNVVATLSAGAVNGCPALSTVLTGPAYPLQGLVTRIGCKVKVSKGVYSATC